MNDAELLIECKKGLNIQADTTSFDEVLLQKLFTVKAFMIGAGISNEKMENDLAVGIIVLGVVDLWNLGGGEIKFSPVFYTLLTQLAASSGLLTIVTTSPADEATGVSVSVNPVLTFNKRLSSYSVQMVEYDTQDAVVISTGIDITKKNVTITPSSDLMAGTKYAIVIEATSAAGPSLERTVISFTTA